MSTDVRTATPTATPAPTPMQSSLATVNGWLRIGVQIWAIIALVLASILMAAVIYFGGSVLANLSKIGNAVNTPTPIVSCSVDPDRNLNC